MLRCWLACWLVAFGAIVPFPGDGSTGPEPPRTTLAAHRIVLGDPEAWALVRGSLSGRPTMRIAGGAEPACDGHPTVPGEWDQPADGRRSLDLRRGARLSAAPLSFPCSATGRNPVSRAPPASPLPLIWLV